MSRSRWRVSHARPAAGSRLLPACALLILFGAMPAGLQAAPAAAGFRIAAPVRTVLKNGMTLLVLERREIPLVQLQLMIRSGAAADPAGKGGTASLTAALLSRGTRNRSAQQFAEEVEFVGGSMSATATSDRSTIVGEFASRDLEVGLNLMSDMVENPAFREDEFGKEQRLAIADAGALLDDAERVADEAFRGWLFGKHPYGRPVLGSKRSLQAIARADISAFYQSNYLPNNAVLVVVGDVSASQVAQRVEKYFAAWKRGNVAEARLPEPIAIHGRKVLLIDKPDATQSQIRFGNLGPRRSDPDYFPLAVGNTVLGGSFTSWLVQEVRTKRGLTYDIFSSVQTLRSSGMVFLGTFSKNATAVETINVSLDLVKRLKGGQIPAEDLEKARNFLAGIYPVRIESPDAVAGQFLDIELLGLDPDYMNQYTKRVRGAGPDAVKRAAGKWMPLDDLAIVVVGPAASLKDALAAFGPVTVRPIDAVLDPAP